MDIAVFSAKPYDREYLNAANAAHHHRLQYFDVPLDVDTVGLAAGHGAVCIFVKDVDAVHAEFAGRGAKVVKPPQDYAYGMRDFDVVDLDGNQLVFGMGIDEAG